MVKHAGYVTYELLDYSSELSEMWNILVLSILTHVGQIVC